MSVSYRLIPSLINGLWLRQQGGYPLSDLSVPITVGLLTLNRRSPGERLHRAYKCGVAPTSVRCWLHTIVATHYRVAHALQNMKTASQSGPLS
jgi:hypothetical protein